MNHRVRPRMRANSSQGEKACEHAGTQCRQAHNSRVSQRHKHNTALLDEAGLTRRRNPLSRKCCATAAERVSPGYNVLHSRLSKMHTPQHSGGVSASGQCGQACSLCGMLAVSNRYGMPTVCHPVGSRAVPVGSSAA